MIIVDVLGPEAELRWWCNRWTTFECQTAVRCQPFGVRLLGCIPEHARTHARRGGDRAQRWVLTSGSRTRDEQVWKSSRLLPAANVRSSIKGKKSLSLATVTVTVWPQVMGWSSRSTWPVEPEMSTKNSASAGVAVLWRDGMVGARQVLIGRLAGGWLVCVCRYRIGERLDE